MPDGSLAKVSPVAGLQLDWLVEVLMGKEGFDRPRAERAVEDYRCVLEIAVDHPDRAIAPPASADRAWHHHMMKSVTYTRDCNALFGEYLHHDPEICGTPAFWEAWDFTRAQFQLRRGITLPATDEAKEAMADHHPIRKGAREAGNGDDLPMQCIMMPRADSQPVQCIVMARADAQPVQCIVMARR